MTGLFLFPFLCCASLPFQYERNFGPLPYAKDGIELFLVLESLPVRVETTDPSNIHKTVLRKAQSKYEGTLRGVHVMSEVCKGAFDFWCKVCCLLNWLLPL